MLRHNTLAVLQAQSLQDEALGYLHGGMVNPQDRVLGLLYVPGEASQADQKIFALVRNFWNGVNAGELDSTLLSRDGQVLIRELLAPFIRETPQFYRESLQEPQVQFVGQAADEQGEDPAEQVEEDSMEDAEAKASEEQLASIAPRAEPTESLRLSRVRLANPIIEGVHARLRSRLEINDNSAFIRSNIFLLQEDGLWKIDAIDIDWSEIVYADETVQTFGEVFGRKQELSEE